MGDKMRDIKFRGKTLDDGRWVYGSLIISKPFVDGVREAWIREETILPLGTISTPTANFIRVDTKTVGQYTGLKGKNGREVYEGDILLQKDTRLIVKWDDRHAMYKCFFVDLAENYYNLDDTYIRDFFEVVGNIHENPEMLK